MGQNHFDHYVFDLDETLADSRFLKPDREIAARNSHLRPALHARIATMRAFAGIPELLQVLKHHGAHVTLLTNSWHDYATQVVRQLELPIDDIVAPARKPNPTALTTAVRSVASRNGGKRVVHVGDSRKDLQASIAAHVPFILCLWGELDGVPLPVAEQHTMLVGVARSVPELQSLLTAGS